MVSRGIAALTTTVSLLHTVCHWLRHAIHDIEIEIALAGEWQAGTATGLLSHCPNEPRRGTEVQVLVVGSKAYLKGGAGRQDVEQRASKTAHSGERASVVCVVMPRGAVD